MRMRKRNNLEPRLEACSAIHVRDGKALRGNWRSLMPSAKALWLEIGCGKGVSTVQMAHDNPGVNLVAIDEVRHVLAVTIKNAAQEYGDEPVNNLLLAAVVAVIGAGFVIFTLRTIDGSGASYWNLFDGFAMFFRIIWLYIVEGFFIFLWSLLFFFPGIIAMYRYRMAIYLLLEHPEMSVMDCIRESKRLMSGHKWELFVFDLSFFGWALLIGFVDGFGASLGITLLCVSVLGYVGYVFLLPYMNLSYSLYYRQLTTVPASGAGDDWTPEL